MFKKCLDVKDTTAHHDKETNNSVATLVTGSERKNFG